MTTAGTWKPAATARTRLALAAGLWSAVGCGLLVAGVRWTVLAADPPGAAIGLAVALAVGAAKGRWILARRARANARRIREAGDGRCVGGTFTWPMWGLAVVMMGLGIFLRHSALPRYWLGLIYAGVGTALAGASAVVWRDFLKAEEPPLRPS